jgi:hypothetical protein
MKKWPAPVGRVESIRLASHEARGALLSVVWAVSASLNGSEADCPEEADCFVDCPGDACVRGTARWGEWLLLKRGERRQQLDLYRIHARDHHFKFIRYKSRAIGPAHVARLLVSKEEIAAAAAGLARSCTAALLHRSLWQGTAQHLQWH